TYQTAGAELTADFNLFSLQVPLDMGLRCTRRFEEGDWHFGAVVNLPGSSGFAGSVPSGFTP
ncbi:MAG: hypothetical protein OXH50_09345, partial [Gemmatimonadetes bacterium]|nr:hypothetical protein [Gemmatimonadota bacterium]